MQFKDYYDILGVKPDASEAEIKTAYRRLARKYHPDVSKEAGAEERFKAANEANEVLGDPKKRAHYDRARASGFRGGEDFRPPPGFGEGAEFDFGGGPGGFSDFFESLFGRARASRGPGAERQAPDDVAHIDVELDAVYNGGTQRVRIGERTLDVKIPKGIQPGQQIRLSGQGRNGRDLRLEIGYRADPRFRIEGRDVIHTLLLTPWEAALGAEIGVPTLAGTVQLRIPADSDGGKRLRLRGRGLPGGNGQPEGDQFVELAIRVPPAETQAQKDLYRQMAEAFRFDPRGR